MPERELPEVFVVGTVSTRRGTTPGAARVLPLEPREPRGRERRRARERQALAPPVPIVLPEIIITAPRPAPPPPAPVRVSPRAWPWWLLLFFPLNTRQPGRRRPGELPFPDEEQIATALPPGPPPPPLIDEVMDDEPEPEFDWEGLIPPYRAPPWNITSPPFPDPDDPPEEIIWDNVGDSESWWPRPWFLEDIDEPFIDIIEPIGDPVAPTRPAQPGPSFAPVVDPGIIPTPIDNPFRPAPGPRTQPRTRPGPTAPDVFRPAFPGPGLGQRPRPTPAPRVIGSPRGSPRTKPGDGQQLDPFPQPQPLRADPCVCPKPKKKTKDRPKPRLECKEYTVRQRTIGSIRFNVKTIPCR